MDERNRLAHPRRPAAQVHQAAGVGAHERVRARSRPPAELVVGHRHRHLGLAHGEGAAEAAAQIGARQRARARAGALEQPSRRVGDAELAQHVAGVVVGDASAFVAPRELDTLRVEERGQLPDVERLAADQLRQVVRGHRRARARGDDDRRFAREGPDERARDPAAAARWPELNAGWPQQT